MGLIGYLNLQVLYGITLILHRRFDPGAYLPDTERYHVSALGGAPPVFMALLAHSDWTRRDLSSVRGIASGTGPLAVEAIHQLQDRMPGALIVEAYGLTEVTMAAVSNSAWQHGTRKEGTVGIPLPDTACKLVAVDSEDPRLLPLGTVGEVAIQGCQVMRGYHGQPEATRQVLQDDGFGRETLGSLTRTAISRFLTGKKTC